MHTFILRYNITTLSCLGTIRQIRSVSSRGDVSNGLAMSPRLLLQDSEVMFYCAS